MTPEQMNAQIVRSAHQTFFDWSRTTGPSRRAWNSLWNEICSGPFKFFASEHAPAYLVPALLEAVKSFDPLWLYQRYPEEMALIALGPHDTAKTLAAVQRLLDSNPSIPAESKLLLSQLAGKMLLGAGPSAESGRLSPAPRTHEPG